MCTDNIINEMMLKKNKVAQLVHCQTDNLEILVLISLALCRNSEFEQVCLAHIACVFRLRHYKLLVPSIWCPTPGENMYEAKYVTCHGF